MQKKWQKKWWKEAVFYQIYPRSFRDSDGDGIGDLRGIIEKLDYLQELGIGAVWLSPVYQSPNDDNGYDISDYQAIMAEFGTPADWEEMLEGMHRRGIRLVMDLVVNHTSDEHAWFVEARASTESPYRDYYIWRPGKEGREPKDGGREPNNWGSFFSGSAWTLDEPTGEYYLHLFSPRQPDLNWENPAVRAEVFAMMRWWVEKGIDGFRMDVINLISKDPALPDAPVAGADRYQFGGAHFVHGPRLLEYLGEMKRAALSGGDLVTVGETPMATTEMAIELTHEESGPLDMVFQFEHMGLDARPGGSKWELQPWSLRELKRVMSRWQEELEGKGWNSLYLSNHDQPRPVSRFGDDGRYRVESAKLLATFLQMQQGSPYIYQGDEIGMTNVRFASIEEYRDIESLNMYREAVEERGQEPQTVLAAIHVKGRDNARTPMQWDASANAGFTTGTPWMAVNPNYTQINVAQALADPDSIFHYYRRLIQLRKERPVIVYGRYALILEEHEQVYAFTRTLEEERLLVLLNFGGAEAAVALPAPLDATARALLIGNYAPAPEPGGPSLTLRPWEARVYTLGA